MRSVSKFGLSLITVPFPDGTDVYFARQLVQQRLGDAKGACRRASSPRWVRCRRPWASCTSTCCHSDSLSLTQLKTLNDYTIRPRLRTVPGVSEVNSWGGYMERIEVDGRSGAAGGAAPDPDRRARRPGRNSMAFGGSYLEQGGERYTLRGLGRVERAAEIERVVVTSHRRGAGARRRRGTVRLARCRATARSPRTARAKW